MFGFWQELSSRLADGYFCCVLTQKGGKALGEEREKDGERE